MSAEHSWSICEMSCIHNRAVTNPIVKALQCICLLTFSMLGRHVSTQHFIIFSYFPLEIVFGFLANVHSIFCRKNKKNIIILSSAIFAQRVLNLMLISYFVSYFVAVSHILYSFMLYCSKYIIIRTVHFSFCSVQQKAADLSFGFLLKKPTCGPRPAKNCLQ